MKRPTRAKRAEQIKLLLAYGKTRQEIAERLGLSEETVRIYSHDAVGKYRWRGDKIPCPFCDNQMRKTSRMCVACDRIARNRWTRERIIGALQRFYFVYGEVPTQQRMLQLNDGNYPAPATVQTRFGTWEKGVRAAGFPEWKRGSQVKGRPRPRVGE